MNQFTLKIFLILTSLIQSVLWIAGLLLADVQLVILAIIIVIVILPVIYRYRNNISELFQRNDKIMEDERTQLINEKSSTLTLGVLIGTIIYAGVFIVTLRNVYPQLLVAGYTLLITALFGLIITIMSRTYYNRRY